MCAFLSYTSCEFRGEATTAESPLKKVGFKKRICFKVETTAVNINRSFEQFRCQLAWDIFVLDLIENTSA